MRLALCVSAVLAAVRQVHGLDWKVVYLCGTHGSWLEARKMQRWTPGFAVLVCLVWSSFSLPLAFGSVAFTCVADETVTIPDGFWMGQPFSAFTSSGILSPPGIDEGRVIFLGKPASGYHNGVFGWVDGSIHLIADPSSGVGTSFRYPSIQGGEYAFSAYSAIYRTVDGIPTMVHGDGQFTGSSRPSLDGDLVWFHAEGSGSQGIYRWDNGSITTVARKGQIAPGSGYAFSNLNCNVSGGQGKVAFWGRTSSSQGIYKYVDGALHRVAATSMAAPGDGAGTFQGFENSPIAYDGETLGFFASDTVHGYGIYVERDGRLEPAAVNGQPAPGGGEFVIFPSGSGNVSTDNGHVAFAANITGGGRAIYTDLSGSLEPIIARGDSLFGQTVSGLKLGVEALSDNQIAFLATFSNGNSGIFVGTVPEPSTFILLSMATLALTVGWWRRRRAA